MEEHCKYLRAYIKEKGPFHEDFNERQSRKLFYMVQTKQNPEIFDPELLNSADNDREEYDQETLEEALKVANDTEEVKEKRATIKSHVDSEMNRHMSEDCIIF